MAVWLAAIEARALARLGKRDGAIRALERVDRERDRVATGGHLSTFDGIGGIPDFRGAEAALLRRIGEYELATANAESAIAGYQAGAPEHRSYGDEAIAWVDLAIARASGQQADLDGCAQALGVIENQPAERRLASLAGPLRDLGVVLSAAPVRDSGLAAAMRGTIKDLISACERPRAEVGA